MSVTSFEILTRVLRDAYVGEVNSSLAYSNDFDPNALTLLPSNGVDLGGSFSGILYTPDISDSADCYNASQQYTANVTTRADLPEYPFDLVGLAPWLSPLCAQTYLSQAHQDPKVRGLLFFPTDGEGSDMDSSAWSSSDGGSWRQQNDFPIYRVSRSVAGTMLGISRQYSKNITDLPFGDQLTQEYGPRSYIRLGVFVDTAGNGTNLPSLWIFLLIVLGILLAVIALTSIMMHYLQRRRRQALRRRVANGEVDLEALGIKRLTVPQHLLDKMPLYKYGSSGAVLPPSAAKESAAATDKLESAHSSRPSSPELSAQPARTKQGSFRPTTMSQPTCAICLDDYVPVSDESEGTTVRELPCHHIFHPECVDAFLKDNSSLCPICKRTALPKGYCPRTITNAMVRRERLMGRVRQRQRTNPSNNAAAEAQETEDTVPPLSSFGRSMRSGTRTFSGMVGIGSGRRISSAPTPTSQPMTEMQPPAPTLARSNSTNASSSPAPQNSHPQPPATPGRREWARQRAVNMLGGRAAPDADEEEQRTTPKWRKAIRGVFPGFGR